MSRPDAIVSAATVDLEQSERDWLDVIKEAGGYGSDANALRMGLYHLAKHLDVPIALETFRYRSPTVRRERKSA